MITRATGFKSATVGGPGSGAIADPEQLGEGGHGEPGGDVGEEADPGEVARAIPGPATTTSARRGRGWISCQRTGSSPQAGRRRHRPGAGRRIAARPPRRTAAREAGRSRAIARGSATRRRPTGSRSSGQPCRTSGRRGIAPGGSSPGRAGCCRAGAGRPGPPTRARPARSGGGARRGSAGSQSQRQERRPRRRPSPGGPSRRPRRPPTAPPATRRRGEARGGQEHQPRVDAAEEGRPGRRRGPGPAAFTSRNRPAPIVPRTTSAAESRVARSESRVFRSRSEAIAGGDHAGMSARPKVAISRDEDAEDRQGERGAPAAEDRSHPRQSQATTTPAMQRRRRARPGPIRRTNAHPAGPGDHRA